MGSITNSSWTLICRSHRHAEYCLKPQPWHCYTRDGYPSICRRCHSSRRLALDSCSADILVSRKYHAYNECGQDSLHRFLTAEDMPEVLHHSPTGTLVKFRIDKPVSVPHVILDRTRKHLSLGNRELAATRGHNQGWDFSYFSKQIPPCIFHGMLVRLVRLERLLEWLNLIRAPRNPNTSQNRVSCLLHMLDPKRMDGLHVTVISCDDMPRLWIPIWMAMKKHDR